VQCTPKESTHTAYVLPACLGELFHNHFQKWHPFLGEIFRCFLMFSIVADIMKTYSHILCSNIMFTIFANYLSHISVVYWPEFLATDPEVRVRFPALPDFLRSKWVWNGPSERKSSGSGLENRRYGLGIRHVDHVAASIRKTLALTSPTRPRCFCFYSSH
jgi:hypothetical protein